MRFELDDEALRWAAAEGVPASVIAAIFLLHEERSVDQIVARLTTAELEMVIKIAGRSPQIYPPGAYDALKEERVRRLMQRAAARSPGARISPAAVRMRKTRERRRQNLRLVTIEVPLNAYEAGKRGDFAASMKEHARMVTATAFILACSVLTARAQQGPEGPIMQRPDQMQQQFAEEGSDETEHGGT